MIKPHNSADLAVEYYNNDYKYDLTNSYKRLVKALETVGYRGEITLLLVCDEARHLCEISAADGSSIQEDCDMFRGEKVSTQSAAVWGNVPFSTFRALRRALRFLAEEGDPVPRVFGLFTDTSSRLTNS